MLCLVFYCLMRKSNGLIQSILDDDDLKLLFKNCRKVLENEIFGSQDVCLKLLLIILTGVDSLNENSLIEYLMADNLFDALIHLVQLHRLTSSNNDEHQSKGSDMGNDVVLTIVLLTNYRKNESTNPFQVQLSIFANEIALNSFGSIINNKLVE